MFAFIACLVTAGLLIPIAAPLGAWLLAKDKGPFVSFHLHQAMAFQAAGFLVNFVAGIIISIIALFTCGIGGFLGVINIAIWMALWMALWIYPIMVGLSAKNGEWKEYAMVGAKVMEMKEPFIK